MWKYLTTRPTRKFDGFRLLFWIVLAFGFCMAVLVTSPGHVLSPFGDVYIDPRFDSVVER